MGDEKRRQGRMRVRWRVGDKKGGRAWKSCFVFFVAAIQGFIFLYVSLIWNVCVGEEERERDKEREST